MTPVDYIEEVNFRTLVDVALNKTSFEDWRKADRVIVDVNIPRNVILAMDAIEDVMRKADMDVMGLRSMIETSFVNNLMARGLMFSAEISQKEMAWPKRVGLKALHIIRRIKSKLYSA